MAHALTQTFMKERSSCCVTEKLEWLTHIEAVLEILSEAIVVTNQDEKILFVNSPSWSRVSPHGENGQSAVLRTFSDASMSNSRFRR